MLETRYSLTHIFQEFARSLPDSPTTNSKLKLLDSSGQSSLLSIAFTVFFYLEMAFEYSKSALGTTKDGVNALKQAISPVPMTPQVAGGLIHVCGLGGFDRSARTRRPPVGPQKR